MLFIAETIKHTDIGKLKVSPSFIFFSLSAKLLPTKTNVFFLEKFQSEGGGAKTVWNFSEKWKSCARISTELAHAIKSKKNPFW